MTPVSEECWQGIAGGSGGSLHRISLNDSQIARSLSNR